MVESNSIECNSIESIEHNSVDTSNLNNQQFRLNKISEIELEILLQRSKKELMSKKNAAQTTWVYLQCLWTIY